MIDTHAHLSERFKQEVNLDRLEWVVLSASCLQDSKDNLELAATNQKLLPAVGIHPTETTADLHTSIFKLEEMLEENKNIIAVGECGLELVESQKSKSQKEKQELLFRGQIELAIKYSKPLIVHSREASEETLSVLKCYKDLRGVIHCYTGGKKRVEKYLEISNDWYFGIDGNLTYEVGLEEVVKRIPKNRLVLETDSPFLSPVPHRSEQNKPEWIEFTYKKVAEIWQMSFGETEKIIDENARRLFQIFPQSLL